MMTPEQTSLAPARWWRIAPVLFLTFSFAYVDRVNYAFAAVGGIGQDLGISSAVSSLLSALFFLGYFAFQVPGALYAEKHSPKRLIFLCLISWGSLSALTGVVSNVPALMLVRFLLGAVEAAVFPALLIFINRWFIRSERSLANAFVVLATPTSALWMSVVSGYFVHSFGWRMMFILEGLPVVLWGGAWWLLVQDCPLNATWLPEAQRIAIETTIAREQQGLKTVRNYSEAFRNPAVIRLSLLYFFWAVGLFGFVLWLPSIIREGGVASTVELGWLSAGPYLAVSLAMVAGSVASDRLRSRIHFVWPALLAAAIGFLLLFALRPAPFWLSYTLLNIVGVGVLAPIPVFFCIPAEILPKNVTGGASALINSLGALGGFAGTYLVGLITGLTGNSAASFLLMGCSLLISTMLWLPRSQWAKASD